MAAPHLPPRTIVPPAGAKKTRPTHIVPGSLHLFTHPAQKVTAPVRAHFARRYNRPGPFGAALFLFDALAAALVLALAVTLGSFILAPGAAAPLRLSVSASDAQVRAADTIGFVVSYENRGKLPLEEASLALSLPDGFRTTSLEAEGALDATIEPLTAHGVIPLGTIGPGGNGTVRVAGYVLQPENATSDLRLLATLTGTQKDKQTVQSVSEVVVRVSGSALQLRWAGAPHAVTVADRNPTYVLVAENDGRAKVDDLSVGIECLPAYPFDCPNFRGTLPPGESRVIGEFTYIVSKTGPRAGMVSIVGGRTVELATAVADVKVSNEGPRVEDISASVSGEGLEVRMRVGFGGLGVNQLQPRFFPQPWSAIDTENLPSDAEVEGILGQRVQTGPEKTDIVFLIPLKTGTDTSALTIRAVASTDYAWSSSERVAVQAAAPTLAAELRYYTEEGEQLGRGPLPPRVAEKTEYWVVVRAEPGQITQDTELRVDLGPNVSYAGKFSASVSGVPRQVGNALVWRPDVIVGDGVFTFAAALAFRPTADQIDAEAVIVRSIRLLGKDADGNGTEAATGSLVTDVPADPRAAEKGTRVAPALE